MFKRRISKEVDDTTLNKEKEQKEKKEQTRSFTDEELEEIKKLIDKSKRFNLKVSYLPRYKDVALSSYKNDIKFVKVIYLQEVSNGDKVLINFT